MTLGGSSSEVYALSITGFQDGIELNGGGSGNAIRDSFLGLDTTETIDGNFYGINLVDSTGNFIEFNTVSGNGGSGILAQGPSVGNLFTANYVGTDFFGTIAKPNQGIGMSC